MMPSVRLVIIPSDRVNIGHERTFYHMYGHDSPIESTNRAVTSCQNVSKISSLPIKMIVYGLKFPVLRLFDVSENAFLLYILSELTQTSSADRPKTAYF